jgi:hypothetical protein
MVLSGGAGHLVRRVNFPSSSATHLQMEDGVKVRPDQVDSMFARELQGLSIHDRSRAEEEIHGVRSVARTETPEMIREARERLDEALLEIALMEQVEEGQGTDAAAAAAAATTSTVSAVVAAIRKNINESSDGSASSHHQPLPYIRTLEFQLLFLRAELFDTSNAARRCWKYLNSLVSFFGPFALTRPLMHADLGREEVELLSRGQLQVLPSRDRAGRLVVYMQGTYPDVTHTCRMRTLLYFFSSVAEDVETQMHGVVVIFSILSMPRNQMMDPAWHRSQTQLNLAFPFRFSAMHLCLPEGPEFDMIRALYYFSVNQNERVRTRVHPALTCLETQYRLMSFGMNGEEIPETSTGTPKLKNHRQWTKTRRAIDAARQLHRDQQLGGREQHLAPSRALSLGDQNPPPAFSSRPNSSSSPSNEYDTFGCVLHPGIHDVLFSRGPKQKNWGNWDYQYLVSSRHEAYGAASDRTERRDLRSEIIDQVYAGKGRFLVRSATMSIHDDVAAGNRNGSAAEGGAGAGAGGRAGAPDEWWVELTNVQDLHHRISKSMYEHHRNDKAWKKQQSSLGGTAKFSGLDDAHNPKRRKIVDEYGDVDSTSPSGLCGGSNGCLS